MAQQTQFRTLTLTELKLKRHENQLKKYWETDNRAHKVCGNERDILDPQLEHMEVCDE